MDKINLGIIGARNLLGQELIKSLANDYNIHAFSRQSQIKNNTDESVNWYNISIPNKIIIEKNEIPFWICVAPIWVLPQYFDFIKLQNVKQFVAISSTSLFTKKNSSDNTEKALAKQYAEGEENLQSWAKANSIALSIFRTTMIYGHGKDKNIAEISRFINRWGFFPILGKGCGLRQPIHVDDLIHVCKSIISSPTKSTIYTISGGEIVSYVEMVTRVFTALKKRPRLIYVPRWLFKIATYGMSFFSRYRHWTVAMADRMDSDLIFDHSEAIQDLGFSPRSFLVTSSDLPD